MHAGHQVCNLFELATANNIMVMLRIALVAGLYSSQDNSLKKNPKTSPQSLIYCLQPWWEIFTIPQRHHNVTAGNGVKIDEGNTHLYIRYDEGVRPE